MIEGPSRSFIDQLLLEILTEKEERVPLVTFCRALKKLDGKI